MDTEKEYVNDLKDCLPLMKLSERVGRLKPKDKDLTIQNFFATKKLIYTLLYYNVTPAKLLPLAKMKRKIQDTLVLKDLRLVIKTVNHARFTGQGIPLYDLICYGIIGYIYALDVKFDPGRGNQLSTCAVPWIRQKAQRAVEYFSKAIRLPNHVYSEISKVNMVVRQYTKDYSGESPSSDEIAIRIKEKYGLDFSIDHVEELGRLRYTHTSLDESISDEGNSTLVDFISNTGEDEILEEVETSANKDYVEELLSKLTYEEQKLVNWKFGLIDLNTRRTSSELAKIMNLSLNEYKALEKSTMAKMKLLADRNKVNL